MTERSWSPATAPACCCSTTRSTIPGGIVQIDAKRGPRRGCAAAAGTGHRPATAPGTLTNHGLLEATVGANAIQNIDPANFINDGEILVTDDSTSLLLLNDTLDNSGGIVQIDAKSGPGAVAPTLELQNSVIDGNSTGTLTNHGLLEATTGTANAIQNIDLGNFRNDGTILVDGSSTLTLDADALDNIGGTVTVDATGELDLIDTTISGGNLDGAGTIVTGAGNVDSTLDGVTLGLGTLVTVGVGTLDLTGAITLNSGAEIDATAPGIIDLENATINGGILGGTGTIATGTGNIDSTLNGVTLGAGTTVTASIGTLDLTGTITNTGAEIDATAPGIVDLEGANIVGGTLAGTGTIEVVSGNNTLDGVTVNTTVTVDAGTTLNLAGPISGTGEILVAGSSTINATGTVSILLNAASLPETSLLTLEGTANLIVINLVGDLDAHALTGSLTVTTGDAADNAIVITTGLGQHHDRRQQRRRRGRPAGGAQPRHRDGGRGGDAGGQHADAVGDRQLRGRRAGRRPQRQHHCGATDRAERHADGDHRRRRR